MSLKLNITNEESPEEPYYEYRFVFESDIAKLNIYIEYNLNISKYELLLKAMIENTEYSAEEDGDNGDASMSTKDGFTSFCVGKYGGNSSGELDIKLKNELCVEAMKQFVEHKKAHQQ